MQLSRLWSSKAKLQGAGVEPVPAAGPATDAEISSAIERLKLDWASRHAEHWQHFENLNQADLPPMARELWDNGFVRLEAALTKEEVSRALAELAALDGIFTGDYAGPIPYSSLRKEGIAALEVTEQTPICLDLLTRNDMLATARLLYGDGTNLQSRTVSIKYGLGNIDSANAPHWDHWKHRLKLFLYLTDVTERTAPMIYLRGTNHRDKPSFRFNKDFATNFLPGGAGPAARWQFDGDEQYEAVTFDGPAGTAFVFDARGVHLGQPLVEGHRVMLSSMYTPDAYSFAPY
jgi:hypothetical protein